MAGAPTLSECMPGDLVTLTTIDVDPACALRLREMGLVPGSLVSVLARAPFGSVIVAAEDLRIGLDHATASHLRVSESTQ